MNWKRRIKSLHVCSLPRLTYEETGSQRIPRTYLEAESQTYDKKSIRQITALLNYTKHLEKNYVTDKILKSALPNL